MNPIHAWLARSASECGSPDALLEAAKTLKSSNSRWLIETYAKQWKQKLDKKKRA